jgi:D-alanyl-D-alanine carboxypeptidase
MLQRHLLPRHRWCAGLLLGALTATSALSCSQSGTDESPPEPAATNTTGPPSAGDARREGLEPIAVELQEAVAADLVADPTLIGQIALARSGDAEISAAAGFADPTTRRPIGASHSFRIASVTKTFVAAATLRLVELGEFSVEDPIGPLLPDSLVTLLADGGYRTDQITVRQLLTHTGGVVDFTFGPGMDYLARVLADPTREWSREQQVALAMAAQPVGAPGKTYHYSDTGYALLGAIIETATGTDLGRSLRTLLDYQRLSLDHTYLEQIEPAPPGQPPRLHQYFGDLDTFGWSPTIDLYGGGGLVSTLDDLVTFFSALLEGDVFDQQATLALMLEVPATNTDVRVPGDPRPYAAAAGLFRSDVGGAECWGHEGFWGVSVTVCPALGGAWATSVSQATRSAAYDPTTVARVLHAGVALRTPGR